MVQVVNKAIRDKNGSAAEVLIEVIKIIKKFDTDHNGDAGFKDKAKQKCKDVVMWLYLVSKDEGGIAPTPTTACINPTMIGILNGHMKSKLGWSRVTSPPATRQTSMPQI